MAKRPEDIVVLKREIGRLYMVIHGKCIIRDVTISCASKNSMLPELSKQSQILITANIQHRSQEM
jgi:hypothetical protein